VAIGRSIKEQKRPRSQQPPNTGRVMQNANMNWRQICQEVWKAIESRDTETVESKIQAISKKYRVSRVDKAIYPDLDGLSVTGGEVEQLQELGIVDRANKITKKALDHVIERNDPLFKLLYFLCWKNNRGLSKLSHILLGIQDRVGKGDRPVNGDGLVLRQAGRHLASADCSEPLVDQHTVRAFRAMRCLRVIKDAGKEKDELDAVCPTGQLTKKHSSMVSDYCNWFKKLKSPCRPAQRIRFLRAVDELMMVLGKALQVWWKKHRS
jgi:hypothetical protein